jgi:hypothetical protein
MQPKKDFAIHYFDFVKIIIDAVASLNQPVPSPLCTCVYKAGRLRPVAASWLIDSALARLRPHLKNRNLRTRRLEDIITSPMLLELGVRWCTVDYILDLYIECLPRAG